MQWRSAGRLAPPQVLPPPPQRRRPSAAAPAQPALASQPQLPHAASSVANPCGRAGSFQAGGSSQEGGIVAGGAPHPNAATRPGCPAWCSCSAVNRIKLR